jgi:hypothetical protein
VQLASAPILNGIICATPGFLWTLASPASSQGSGVFRECLHLSQSRAWLILVCRGRGERLDDHLDDQAL